MRRRDTKEGGWALLTILLACAIFMIMMANVVPDAAFEARDTVDEIPEVE